MNTIKKLIGGQKLRELGSDRHTDDVDYLINDPSDDRLFIHTTDSDIVNAARHALYSAVWDMDADASEVSLQALLEMTAYTFVQHCENMNWEKADSKEYDIKFLTRKILASGKSVELCIADKFISDGAMIEVQKIINSVKI